MAAGESRQAEHRSAAWAVVPMGCHVVAVPSEVLDSKVSLVRQLPTDAHEYWLLLADDLADRRAAVPAWASRKWA